MKISIIVPIYKVENELVRCVESLINQTYDNIEIILVDDGSPDDCPIICDQYAKQDFRIKVIHKSNGGLSDARNCGLRAAEGDYILYVDSDDYIDPDSCFRFAELVERFHPDIIVGNALEINGDQKRTWNHTALEENVCYSAEDYIIRSIYANEWYAPVWMNLYKRTYLLKNDLFFKKGILHEDMEILPRLFFYADSVLYLNFDFYYYVIRNTSIMGSLNKNKSFSNIIDIYSDWKKQFDQLQNLKLRRALYGALIRYFLHTCRTYQLGRDVTISGLTPSFMTRYSLNIKEKIKVIIFLISRKLYYHL